MRKLLVLTVAVAFFAVAGCSSDEDGSEDATATTTQADDQTTDTSDASDSADGEGESTGSEAPDGMLEACNGANFYTDPGDVPEVSISSEEERTAIEQKAALSQPITGFEVVEGPNVEGGYLGFGETDGWAGTAPTVRTAVTPRRSSITVPGTNSYQRRRRAGRRPLGLDGPGLGVVHGSLAAVSRRHVWWHCNDPTLFGCPADPS